MRRALTGLLLLAAVTGCGADKEPRLPATATASTAGDLRTFKTVADLAPPQVRVQRGPVAGTSDGFIFLTPRAAKPDQKMGPMILDAKGRLVWFKPLAGRSSVGLTVQRYKGKPVLTWSERPPITSPDDLYRGSRSALYNVIADQSYHVIRRVRAHGAGVRTDLHDLVITRANTALVLGFRNVRRHGVRIVDCVVQEIDLESGKLLFNWSALDHAPISESMVPRPKKGPWDYFHVNSVAEDRDGNLLVSARHTSTVYKLDRHTGRVIWRLGGKRSTIAMGRGMLFYYQHDAQRMPDGTLSVFDNAATEFDKRSDASAVLEIKLDEQAKRASLVRIIRHEKPLLAASQGNARTLPNGNIFVGWGNSPFFSEYTKDGRQVFDAALPTGAYQSYRAFKGAWMGRPSGKPALVVGGKRAYVSWNGATEVVRWRVLGGESPDKLKSLGIADWKGFETRIALPSKPAFVQIEALGKNGKVLGRSAVTKVL